MIMQLDFFKAPEPIIEQPAFILAGNVLALVPPCVSPAPGPESQERKAARLREIEERQAVNA